jgi:sec-independent protein translocase protein TatC
MDDKEYSLVEHLADLRTRLSRALIGVVVVSFAAFGVADQLLGFLRRPMEEILHAARGPKANFVVAGAAEYFVCQMKAALVAGLFVASPWVLLQIWRFVAPGLYDHEKKYVRMFVGAGAFFFCAGGVFCYFVVFPPMFKYLIGMLPADIDMMPNLEEHFSFALKMMLGFGVAFQTPVIVFILSLAGIVDPATLAKYRRHVLLISAILGAVLTPGGDPMSMVLLAGPIFVLFELGVFVSRITIKVSGKPLDRKARAAEEAAKAEASTTEPPQA